MTADMIIQSAAVVNRMKGVFAKFVANKVKFFYKKNPASGRGGEKGQSKSACLRQTPGCLRRSYAMEASFLASFAFLFAALFLCRMPLLAAESIAETVSG